MVEPWKTVVAQLRSQYPPQSPKLRTFDSLVTVLVTEGLYAVFDNMPAVNGRPLDLVGLLQQVIEKGGYTEVQNNNLWPDIGAALGLEGDASTGSSLKAHFINYLHPYYAIHCLKTEQKAREEKILQQQVATDEPTKLPISSPPPGPSPFKKAKHSAEYTSDVQGVNWNRAKTCWEVTYYDEEDNKRRKTFSVTPERSMDKAKAMAENMKKSVIGLSQRNQPGSYQSSKNQQIHQTGQRNQPGSYQNSMNQQIQQQKTQPPPSNNTTPPYAKLIMPSGPTNTQPFPAQLSQHQERIQMHQMPQVQTRSPPPQPTPQTRMPEVPEIVPELPREEVIIITHENFIPSLLSDNFKRVTSAVNILLEITADPTKDFAFSDYPQDLLDAIVTLMGKTNPYSMLIEKNNASMAGIPLGELVESVWQIKLETKLPPELQIEKNASEREAMLLCLLGAVRNASYSVANESLLAYHTGLLAQLVSVLFAAPKNLVAAQAALEIIAQISRHIDITGRRRPEEDVVIENSLDALAPSHIKADRASGDANATATIEYVSTILQIFPQLEHLIQCEERAWILCALETLSKLSQVETNIDIFTRVPDELLRRLSELLYVPASGVDALIPEKDSRRHYHQAELYSRVLLTTDDHVDVEVRDNVLEIFSTLAELSDSVRRRICALPDLVSTLLRIVGIYSRSREVPKLAAYILHSLAQLPANATYFMAHQETLYYLASKDDLVADLLCNTLCDVFDSTT